MPRVQTRFFLEPFLRFGVAIKKGDIHVTTTFLRKRWMSPFSSLPLDSRAPATGHMVQFVQRNLAGIAHRTHQQRTMSHTIIDAFLGGLLTQKAVDASGCEP